MWWEVRGSSNEDRTERTWIRYYPPLNWEKVYLNSCNKIIIKPKFLIYTKWLRMEKCRGKMKFQTKKIKSNEHNKKSEKNAWNKSLIINKYIGRYYAHERQGRINPTTLLCHQFSAIRYDWLHCVVGNAKISRIETCICIHIQIVMLLIC